MRCHGSAVALILSTVVAHASAQVVRGRVMEAESARRLPAATVTLIDYNKQTVGRAVTDTAGNFQIRAPRAGGYQIRFDLLGYTPLTSERIELGARETVQLAVQLSTQALPVTPVVITARQRNRGNLEEFEKRRVRQGSGYFITQDEIEKHASMPASSLVSRVPGVTLKTTRYGSQILLPGTLDVCQASVFVDGTRIQGSVTGVDDLLIPAWIGGIEVYPRAASAPIEYRTNNNPANPNADTDCGVVLYWTRDVESDGGWSWKKIVAAAGLLLYAGTMVAGIK
jgi:hypothetical protein